MQLSTSSSLDWQVKPARIYYEKSLTIQIQHWDYKWPIRTTGTKEANTECKSRGQLSLQRTDGPKIMTLVFKLFLRLHVFVLRNNLEEFLSINFVVLTGPTDPGHDNLRSSDLTRCVV